MSKKPNILFFHVDNLGMGELGCYGGGILRGADTKRMDQFSKEGAKLTPRVQLLGSGTILRESIAAQELLEKDWAQERIQQFLITTKIIKLILLPSTVK